MDNTKSKHFWKTERNLDNAKQIINPKMMLSKTDLKDQYDGKTRAGGIENDSRVPEYYRGKEGYEARKVCDNFDLSYHLGTAVTYLLRSKRKHDSPIECLQKAINHIQFEIENYEEKSRS